jgi:hypothetical protein
MGRREGRLIFTAAQAGYQINGITHSSCPANMGMEHWASRCRGYCYKDILQQCVRTLKLS